MFISKEEYKRLLDRVSTLENDVHNQYDKLFNSWYITEQHIEEIINKYIERKCYVVISNDIKDKIRASLQKKMIDNLFRDFDKDHE